MHKPIKIQHISLFFTHKICFEDFSVEILYGSRIAIIGRNGSGKSSLLKLLMGEQVVSEGVIHINSDIQISYVPQLIEAFDSLSGGQRFNEALTRALAQDPDILLLDEPTNHLDLNNRKSLMRMLSNYQGTLIIVSHDLELLHNNMNTLWHIDQGRVTVFSGKYDDYMRELKIKRSTIEKDIFRLNREKKDMHTSLMKEQQRASKSQAKGKKSIAQRKWPTIVSATKVARGNETAGRKQAEMSMKKDELNQQLSALYLPEVILPKFSFTAAELADKMLISISRGSIAYHAGDLILEDMHFSVSSKERIAIMGDNGSGKSTLIKALMQSPDVIKSGDWHLCKIEDIGYLDQHYGTLKRDNTVLECIRALRPEWTPVEARRHLNDFLFKKNEEVDARVSSLSGGEKARLSLAQIAAKTPHLLILDEMTNNIDLETREHLIQVISNYPGALIVISHDQSFLEALSINTGYECDAVTKRISLIAGG